MIYTRFVVFLCCIWWCCGARLSIQDKQTGQWSAHVNDKNGTALGEDSSWSVELKRCEILELAPNKPEIPEKRKELGYYKFYSTAKTWFGAKEICEQEGARLLVLNSEREFTTIKGVWDTYPKLFTDSSNNYLHIALHDFIEEGRFITLDDLPINETGYSKWGASEPNNGVAANCLAVSRDGLYYDSHCNNLFAFFCEL